MSAEKKSKHRLITCFMAALGAVLAVRLLMLTVIENEKWDSYAEDMSNRFVYETAPRGDIVDRNGDIIASSRAVHSVVISRVDVKKAAALESASEILKILRSEGEDISVTEQQVSEALGNKDYLSYMPIVLAEDVTSGTVKKIQAAGYPGITIATNYVREYPKGAFASHIIGYMGRISEDQEEEYIIDKGYRKDAMIGKTGIERLCEDVLKGEDAVSRLQVDSLGNVTKLIGKSSVKKGDTVRLTIDNRLQETTEAALERAIGQASRGGVFSSKYGERSMVYAPKVGSGAAVAVDVETGQVLAIASYPDFDPNDFVGGISSSKWRSLQQKNPNDPLSPAPLYNIATMSAVQPGSTFKPVTALAALSEGIDAEMTIYDKGRVRIGSQSFGCYLWNSYGSTHGYTNMYDAIRVSCNYYFYKVAERIGSDVILETASRLGLGDKTGIEIEESTGRLPSEALKISANKAALKDHLYANAETYFEKSAIKDNENFEKNIEKIINWSFKDLTLNELIGKLKKEDFINRDNVRQLAEVCKNTYCDGSGWTIGDTYNISIGQGDNAYTPVQMVSYIAALGNDGIRNDLALIYDEESSRSIGPAVNKGDLGKVIDAMTKVASEPGGSLYGTFSGFPYEVAGKTGTAQRAGKIDTIDEKDYLRRHLHLIAPDVSFSQAVAEADRLMSEYPDIYDSETIALRRAVMNLSSRDITSEDIDAYKDNYDNFAWTVALAPADDPQIAVAVMLVQGRAASNAAPVAREIIGKYGEISRWEKSF